VKTPRPAAVAAAVCGLAAAWCFRPILSHGFVNLEDYWLILDNIHLRSLGTAQLRWMATSLEYGTYQPLGWLAYALIHRVAGVNPAAYHLGSWLAHIACTFLLVQCTLRILRAAAPASSERDLALACAAAALTWALHPQRVEQVAWATGLPDVLAIFFFLAAALAYLDMSPGRRRLALVFMLFLVSSLFRWKGVVLPVVLILLDAHILKRSLRRDAWIEKIPFFLAAAIFSALNARSKLLLAPGHAFDFGLRALAGPVFYLGKLLLPFHLTVDYQIPASLPLAAVFLALSAAAFTRRATVGAAWLSFVAALSPALLMSYHGAVTGHDRAAYLPAMSLHLLLAGGLLQVLRRGRQARQAALAAAACVVLTLTWLTRAQLPVWRDCESLWRHVLAQPAPPDYAHLSLAHALLEQGRGHEAAAELREQLRLIPGDPRVESLAKELGRR